MFFKTEVMCPVCRATLGYCSKGEPCSFLCRECQWIFKWNDKGILGKPTKVNPKKPDICDCGSCQIRDTKSRFK